MLTLKDTLFDSFHVDDEDVMKYIAPVPSEAFACHFNSNGIITGCAYGYGRTYYVGIILCGWIYIKDSTADRITLDICICPSLKICPRMTVTPHLQVGEHQKYIS